MPDNMPTNNMPFPADAPVEPKPLDVIEANYRNALEQYQRDKKAHYNDFVTQANAAYAEFLDSHRKKFVKKYFEDNYFELENPYDGKSPAAVYRMTCPYETRIMDLLTAARDNGNDTALYTEAVLCHVYRNNCQLSVEGVKDFLRPYIPVDGEDSIETAEQDDVQVIGRGPFPKMITREKKLYRDVNDDTGVHAEGISGLLREVLELSPLIVERGRVLFADGSREVPGTGRYGEPTQYVWVLASAHQHRFPREQY